MSQAPHDVVQASWQRAVDRLPHQRLSDREYQVLCPIAAGRPLSEVATHLVLSGDTASTYHERILSRMGARTNAELMRCALAHRLVE